MKVVHEYEAPKVEVIGSVADLTLMAASSADTSEP